MCIFILVSLILFLGCSNETHENNLKDHPNLTQDSEQYFKLKYAEEDASALALILSSRAKYSSEVRMVLEKNEIDFEYEVIEDSETLPILLNNYRLVFTKDGRLLYVEPIENE